MAAENDIIIKITGEADLDAAQKQLQELTKQSEDYEKQIEQNKEKEKKVSASLRQSIKNRKELSEVLTEIHRQYNNQRKALKDNIQANKQSIKALTDQIKAYKTLHGQSGSVVQQLRAMREELMQMEDAGEFGSQAFIDLSIAAGKLEDQIGDTQQRIRILASDTRDMDAALGLGDGLAGMFYMATSAAEVFGEDMEGLQKAFYKVQAMMSILSGAQQVYNATQKDSALRVVFTTAAEKLRLKTTQKAAAYERLYNIQKAAGSAANTAQAVTTNLWTKAQWKLNAAIAANPVGAIVAGIVALVAAISGAIYAYQNFFNKSAMAKNAYEEANKKLEMEEAKMAVGQEAREFKRRQQIKKTDDAEEEALAAAKARNASEIELAAIKSKYAKQRETETKLYNNAEIKRNEVLKAEAYNAMEAKRKEAATYRANTKKKKEALEELAEAEEKYYGYAQKIEDLENEKKEAERAVTEAQREAAEARRQMALEAEQANIDLMRNGAVKEIAQIQFNYREKLRNIKGNSAEEIKLRKALEAQQAREIQAVRDKYAQQARQTAIQNQKNLLMQMSMLSGDEESYQKQLDTQKKILKLEAADQIKALNDSVKRQEMSADDAAVKITAIRFQLQKDLNAIDMQDIQRTTEIAKKKTEIFIKEAEAEVNALNGSEASEEQLRVIDKYYAARKKQIEENKKFEEDAAKRSYALGEITWEQKEDRLKEIAANTQAELTQIEKDGATKRIEVMGQKTEEIELALAKAEDEASRAQGVSKLDALRNQYDAQLALYDAQQKELKAKYDAGLITFQDFKKQEWEIEKATIDAEVQYRQNAMQTIADGFQTALGYMQQISDMAFEAINQNIQAQMDALDEEYTTDWEEAQKNADKKYITEKEYERKKAALEEKQAKYAKAQALTNIAIQTALAIMNAMATAPFPINIIQAGIAGAMGAAQLAIAASKPLAQYEKGRKGGKGEYALVGEKGPEIMYIPQGASIVPNNKLATPEAWSHYGVPELPRTDPETLHYAAEQTAIGFSIDYDRLGASVAAALPKQRSNNVTVNVDRSGVHVSDGRELHTYLNAKYCGSWN